MVKNLPDQYVFMLVPCRINSCPHKKCKANEGSLQLRWFTNGPSLEYFPVPIPDPNRPWGGQCTQCEGKCTGHFLTPGAHLRHYEKHGKARMMVKPASRILAESHKELLARNVQRDEATVSDLARKTLLADDIVMWLQHQHFLNYMYIALFCFHQKIFLC